jgi:serine/threonine-protein kinase
MKTHPTYEILDEIGRGGSATVYRARDLALRRYVAIKELNAQFQSDPRHMEQFWEEAQFLANLKHDNIVQVYGLDKDRGWIVMELMQGSLDAKVAEGPLPPDLVRSVLRQTLNALQALHPSKKFHGGVRPANLLIDERGRVKLSDSPGIALTEEMRRPTGSAKYLAPELLNPTFGPVGTQVDLYALGLTALEMLRGPTFDKLFKGVGGVGGNADLTWMRWQSSAAEVLPPVGELLPGVPPDLARVVDKLLAKPVAQRYAVAEDVLRDLDDKPLVLVEPARAKAAPPPVAAAPAAAGPAVRAVGTVAAKLSPPPANPPATKPPAGKRTLNRKVLIGGIAGAAVVVVAGILLLASSGKAETVDVVLQTTAPGAGVRINGVDQAQKTPGNFQLVEGENRLLLTLAGQSDKKVLIVVKADRVEVFDPHDAKTPTVTERTAGKVKEPLRIAFGPEPSKVEPTAKLKITTNPPGANIFINGDKQDKLTNADLTLKVAPQGQSTFDIVIDMNGYERVNAKVKLGPGEEREEAFTLAKSKVGTQGILSLTTTPAGADVYINGVKQDKKTNGLYLVPTQPYRLELGLGDVKFAKEWEIDPRKPGNDKLRFRLVVGEPPRRELFLVTMPPGASVLIDDQSVPVGKTNSYLPIPDTPFRVRFNAAGYEPLTVQLDPDNLPESLVWQLKKLPVTTLGVVIESFPAGASVFIDNDTKSLGKTNGTFQVPNRDFALKIELPGYATSVQPITVAQVQKGKIHVDLTKLEPAFLNVVIESVPPGAAVFFDNSAKSVGKTNDTFKVPNRDFLLKLEMAGYMTWSRTVTAAEAQKGSIRVELAKAVPATISVTIESSPPGASIFIDKDAKPLGKTNGTFQVPNRDFMLRLELPGYEKMTRPVTLAQAQQGTIHVDLVKLVLPFQKVLINSTPPGAAVWVDGKMVGTTNSIFELPTRKFILEITMAGYEPVKKPLDGTKVIPKIDVTLKHNVGLVTTLEDTDKFTLIAGSPQGDFVVAARSGQAAIWDPMTGKQVMALEVPPWANAVFTHLAYAPDGMRIFAHNGSKVLCWNVKDGKVVWANDVGVSAGASKLIHALAPSADGDKVLLIDHDALIVELDGKNGKLIGKAKLYPEAISHAALCLEKMTALLVNQKTFTIARISLKAAKMPNLPVYEGHSSPVFCVALAPDGLTMLSSDKEGTHLWKVASLVDLWTLKVSAVRAAFSPDGKRLLICRPGDNDVYLHDAHTGKQLKTFSGHTVPVRQVVFLTNEYAVTLGVSNKAHVWRLPD